MKKYIVKQNKHDFKPLTFGLYINKISLSYKIKFDESCRYDIGDKDQADINKLFGLGYFSWFKSTSHTDSARFGWSYDRDNEKMGIYSYCYINGQVKYDYNKPICYCDFNKEYEFYLGKSLNNYNFGVWEIGNILSIGNESIPHSHNKNISFLLSPYFGGNISAPHSMTIYMEKK